MNGQSDCALFNNLGVQMCNECMEIGKDACKNVEEADRKRVFNKCHKTFFEAMKYVIKDIEELNALGAKHEALKKQIFNFKGYENE